jgi:hypothetical protein
MSDILKEPAAASYTAGKTRFVLLLLLLLLLLALMPNDPRAAYGLGSFSCVDTPAMASAVMRSLPLAGPALALMMLRRLPDLPEGAVAAVYHTCDQQQQQQQQRQQQPGNLHHSVPASLQHDPAYTLQCKQSIVV